MKATLGGLSVELSREDLLWLVQSTNGNGSHAPRYGDPVHEPNGVPLDEQTALEEALNTRKPMAFVDQEDLINEANARVQAHLRAQWVENRGEDASEPVVVFDDTEPAAPAAPTSLSGYSAPAAPVPPVSAPAASGAS